MASWTDVITDFYTSGIGSLTTSSYYYYSGSGAFFLPPLFAFGFSTLDSSYYGSSYGGYTSLSPG